MRQEPAVCPQIGKRCGTPFRADAEDQDGKAEDNHESERRDFDERAPKFQLAEQFHIHEIGKCDDDEKNESRNPSGQIRQPILHVKTNHGQLCHGDADIEKPIIPAGKETGEFAPVSVRVFAERGGNGMVDRHFAQRSHDEINKKAADGVGQNGGRADGGNRIGCAVKKAGADGTAQRNHLNVTAFEISLQMFLFHGASPRVRFGNGISFSYKRFNEI